MLIFKWKDLLKFNNFDFIKQNKMSLDNGKSSRKFDFSRYPKRRIALMFLYMGWEYNGLALQQNLGNTVEQHLFAALVKTKMIESPETCEFTKCGRTDKGVSAFRQVVALTVRSTDTSNALWTQSSAENGQQRIESTTEMPYIKMLNGVLPKTIRAICWAPVSNEFSARNDCLERIYTYVFPRSLIRSIPRMNEACQHLIGHHDFRNFCHIYRSEARIDMPYLRRINSAFVEKFGSHDSAAPGGFDLFKLTIKASGFLWHQIRCIVSLLYEIGCGNEEPELIRQLLDLEQFSSRPQYNLANELPLCLFDCNFPSGSLEWQFDREAIVALIVTLQRFWAEHQVKATNIKMMLDELSTMVGNAGVDGLFIGGLDEFMHAGPVPKNYEKISKRPRCKEIAEIKEKLEAKRRTKTTEATQICTNGENENYSTN